MTGELLQRILDFVREHNLVARDSTLVVGVSGGPDSVCLLHALSVLKDELGVRLTVAHLNHGLRGQDADGDARYVWQLSRALGIPSTLDKRDVNAYRERRRVSLEEAAREVRYAFLGEVAALVGADRVAVGHTADDNIETILLHLIRGSGSRGLRGLSPLRGWKSSPGGQALTVVRPLLPITREETEAYCEENRLSARLDASNLSLSPLRNRLRHQLLPLLMAYNPRFDEALLRTGAIVSDDLAHIEKEGDRVWGAVALETSGIVLLDRQGMLDLDAALRRHVLRRAIEGLLGNLRDIELKHIEEMMDALPKPAGKSINLPGRLVFTVEYDRYVLGFEPEKLCPYPALEGEHKLAVPGATLLPGWRVEAAVVDKAPAAAGDAHTAYLDWDRVGSALKVRARQPGDRFQPLGMEQPKKLGEFMIDARIPRSWRSHIPLVCIPDRIVWVVGWRIDERMKVTAGTQKVLVLNFERS